MPRAPHMHHGHGRTTSNTTTTTSSSAAARPHPVCDNNNHVRAAAPLSDARNTTSHMKLLPRLRLPPQTQAASLTTQLHAAKTARVARNAAAAVAARQRLKIHHKAYARSARNHPAHHRDQTSTASRATIPTTAAAAVTAVLHQQQPQQQHAKHLTASKTVQHLSTATTDSAQLTGDSRTQQQQQQPQQHKQKENDAAAAEEGMRTASDPRNRRRRRRIVDAATAAMGRVHALRHLSLPRDVKQAWCSLTPAEAAAMPPLSGTPMPETSPAHVQQPKPARDRIDEIANMNPRERALYIMHSLNRIITQTPSAVSFDALRLLRPQIERLLFVGSSSIGKQLHILEQSRPQCGVYRGISSLFEKNGENPLLDSSGEPQQRQHQLQEHLLYADAAHTLQIERDELYKECLHLQNDIESRQTKLHDLEEHIVSLSKSQRTQKMRSVSVRKQETGLRERVEKLEEQLQKSRMQNDEVSKRNRLLHDPQGKRQRYTVEQARKLNKRVAEMQFQVSEARKLNEEILTAVSMAATNRDMLLVKVEVLNKAMASMCGNMSTHFVRNLVPLTKDQATQVHLIMRRKFKLAMGDDEEQTQLKNSATSKSRQRGTLRKKAESLRSKNVHRRHRSRRQRNQRRKDQLATVSDIDEVDLAEEEIENVGRTAEDDTEVVEALETAKKLDQVDAERAAAIRKYVSDLRRKRRRLNRRASTGHTGGIGPKLESLVCRSSVKIPLPSDVIQCAGNSPLVPAFMRYNGVVRKWDISKQYVEMIIKEIWSFKMLKDESFRSAPVPMMTTLAQATAWYFRWHFSEVGDTEALRMEVIYNFMAACDRFAYDEDVRIFRAVLLGEMSEDIYYDHMNMIAHLKHMLVNLDLCDCCRDGLILKDAFFMGLRLFFPLKSEEDWTAIRSVVIDQMLSPGPPSGVTASYADDTVMYVDIRKLLSENEEGDESAFMDLVRSQFLREVTSFTMDINRELHAEAKMMRKVRNEAETLIGGKRCAVAKGEANDSNMKAAHRAKDSDGDTFDLEDSLLAGQICSVLSRLDPLKSDEEIETYMLIGLGLHELEGSARTVQGESGGHDFVAREERSMEGATAPPVGVIGAANGNRRKRPLSLAAIKEGEGTSSRRQSSSNDAEGLSVAIPADSDNAKPLPAPEALAKFERGTLRKRKTLSGKDSSKKGSLRPASVSLVVSPAAAVRSPSAVSSMANSIPSTSSVGYFSSQVQLTQFRATRGMASNDGGSTHRRAGTSGRKALKASSGVGAEADGSNKVSQHSGDEDDGSGLDGDKKGGHFRWDFDVSAYVNVEEFMTRLQKIFVHRTGHFYPDFDLSLVARAVAGQRVPARCNANHMGDKKALAVHIRDNRARRARGNIELFRKLGDRLATPPDMASPQH